MGVITNKIKNLEDEITIKYLVVNVIQKLTVKSKTIISTQQRWSW